MDIMVKASRNDSGADNIENQRPPKIPAVKLNFYVASHPGQGENWRMGRNDKGEPFFVYIENIREE